MIKQKINTGDKTLVFESIHQALKGSWMLISYLLLQNIYARPCFATATTATQVFVKKNK